MVRLPAVGELAVFVDSPVGSVRKLKHIDISIYNAKYKNINIFVFVSSVLFFNTNHMNSGMKRESPYFSL